MGSKRAPKLMQPYPAGIETARKIAWRISKLAGHDVIAASQQDDGWRHCEHCQLWIATSRLLEELTKRAVMNMAEQRPAPRRGPPKS